MEFGALPQSQIEPVPALVPGLPLPAVRPSGPRAVAPRAVVRARNRQGPLRKEPPDGAPFRGFWMGGYECPHFLQQSSRADARDSYSRLLEFGIRTVREDADWARIDRGGRHDLAPLEERSRMAKDLGIQLVWTLFSHQWPDDVAFLSAAFVSRFGRYAGALAARVAAFDPSQVPVFVPVNEISYLAWSLHSRGAVRRTDGSRPSLEEIKRQLVRAAIAAGEAILEKVPHARLMHTDPLEHVVAPARDAALAAEAERRGEQQFEAWDWIAGRSAPELGGRARLLDLVGANYYVDNQWEIGTGKRLGWQIDDPRRVPLSLLLAKVHRRYARPVVIAETGHTGVRRGAWIREVASEVRLAQRLGVKMEGICLHPIVDQLDGANPGKWLQSGLWEVRSESGTPTLELSPAFAAALRSAQKLFVKADDKTAATAETARGLLA